MTTHDRISQELALRQLPLLVVVYYYDNWFDADGETLEAFADAINHARLAGSSQLFLKFTDSVAQTEDTDIVSRVASLLNSFAMPGEQFVCEGKLSPGGHFRRCCRPTCLMTITRTTKHEEQPAVPAEPAP